MRLLLPLGVSWLVLAGSACSPPAPKCDAASCRGCCDADGVCQLGDTAQHCGALGGVCNACSLGLVCNAGVCGPFSASGGGSATGGGDGATGGGDGTGGGAGTGGGTSTGGGAGTGGSAGTGGGTPDGPRIAVTPTTLAFGQVFTASATPTPVQRTLTLQNVGAATSSLFLGRVSNGTPGQQPYFESSGSSEFTAHLSNTYDPLTGLPATHQVDLTVTLLPTSPGLKTASVTVHSNDESQPAVVVTLTAEVLEVPPCSFTVTPTQATFGVVAPGSIRDLAITVTNTGSGPHDLCFLTGVTLGAASHAAFSLVGGPVASLELQPGEVRQLVVRLAPTGLTPPTPQPVTGLLEFDISTASGTHVTVPLTASIGAGCLNVVSNPLDFGAVRLGCGSATRSFSIYNTCPATVTLTSLSLQTAAGQPPGGPDCAGAQPCPEFFLAATPTIPGGGLAMPDGGTPVAFQARYTPIDVGPDQGTVAINSVENNQSVTTLVELNGRGTTTGTQLDTHTQPLQRKSDVLLVVDDSCSMQDKQTALSQNFGSFIQYAVTENVDYRIGVTTTTEALLECIPNPLGGAPICVTNQSKGPEGRLVVDSQTQLKWVAPTTPQVSTVFGRLVNVGTGGGSFEAPLACATRALTMPVVAGANAGFLRDDADLAVVVVTDAHDQSSQPVSYYQDLLANVKGAQRLSRFTFSAMVPTLAAAPAGCTYDTQDMAPQRYQPVVQSTGGALEEICTADWPSALQNLGRAVFSARSTYTLRNAPDLAGALTVRVNGQVVPGCAVPSGCTTWFYDATSNAVKFDAAATPAPGATVEIQYVQSCFAP